MNNNTKSKISEKTLALERESNITLISTAVMMCSIFLLFYVQNLMKTDYLSFMSFTPVVEWVYLIGALASGVVAVWKKKRFLFEYTAFFLIMAIGYYLLKNGAMGVTHPFSDPLADGNFTFSSFDANMIKIINGRNVTIGLWGAKLLYVILSMTLHTVKYSKIKNAAHGDNKQLIPDKILFTLSDNLLGTMHNTIPITETKMASPILFNVFFETA